MQHTYDTPMAGRLLETIMVPALAALLLVFSPFSSMAATVSMHYTGKPYDYDPLGTIPPDGKSTWDIVFDRSALDDNLLTQSEMIDWRADTPRFRIDKSQCDDPFAPCSPSLSLSFQPETLNVADYLLSVSFSFTTIYTRSVPVGTPALYDELTGPPAPFGGSTTRGSWAVVPVPGAVWLLGSGLLGFFGIGRWTTRRG